MMNYRVLRRLILVCFCLSSGFVAFAQSDCGEDCQCILQKARNLAADLENPDFQKALTLFNAAKLCMPDSVALIDNEIVNMFEGIKALKNRADSVSQVATKKTEELEEQTITLESEREKLEDSNTEIIRLYGELRDNQKILQKINENLIKEKQKNRAGYLKSESLRLDNLILGQLNQKNQFLAWELGKYKLAELGDSIGLSIDTLVEMVFEQDNQILMRRFESSLDTPLSWVDSSTQLMHQLNPYFPPEIQVNDQGLYLTYYPLPQAEKQNEYIVVLKDLVSNETLKTFNQTSLKKAVFSEDGTRLGLFSKDNVWVYEIYPSLEGKFLFSEITPKTLQKIASLNLNIIDLVFAYDNELFMVTDRGIYSVSDDDIYHISDQFIFDVRPLPAYFNSINPYSKRDKSSYFNYAFIFTQISTRTKTEELKKFLSQRKENPLKFGTSYPYQKKNYMVKLLSRSDKKRRITDKYLGKRFGNRYINRSNILLHPGGISLLSDFGNGIQYIDRNSNPIAFFSTLTEFTYSTDLKEQYSWALRPYEAGYKYKRPDLFLATYQGNTALFWTPEGAGMLEIQEKGKHIEEIYFIDRDKTFFLFQDGGTLYDNTGYKISNVLDSNVRFKEELNSPFRRGAKYINNKLGEKDRRGILIWREDKSIEFWEFIDNRAWFSSSKYDQNQLNKNERKRFSISDN